MQAMIRVIVLTMFITAFAYMPVYAFENLVEPQLESLSYSYAHAGETVDRLFPQQQ